MTTGRDERSALGGALRLHSVFGRPFAKLNRMLKIKGLNLRLGDRGGRYRSVGRAGRGTRHYWSNGAGKTTLSQSAIAGGLAPDAGEIRRNGRDITAAKPLRSAVSLGSDARIRSLGLSRISRYSRICWLLRYTAEVWRTGRRRAMRWVSSIVLDLIPARQLRRRI